MSQSTFNDYEFSGDHPWRDERVMRELYEERGLRAETIGDRFGVTSKTINQWLDRLGIEKRDASEERLRGILRKPASFNTKASGYEFWSSKRDGEVGRVYVHRLLAVAKYGFDAVTSDVDVHHRNNIPWDNRPDNIELMGKAEHQNHHAERSVIECEVCGETAELCGRGLCNRCYDRLYYRHIRDSGPHVPEECRWCED